MNVVACHVKMRQASSIDDLLAIKALIKDTNLDSLHGYTPDSIGGASYWIADLNGVPSGCIGLEKSQGGATNLRSLVVAEQARNQGLGSALLTSAIAHATLRGDHTIYLVSPDTDYWQRRGFVTTGKAELIQALCDSEQVKNGLASKLLSFSFAWKKELK